jgi:Flp pilus assembly CpaF family ATPase
MEQRFESYLKKIGMTGTLRMRAQEIYRFYEALLPDDEITDIFVSEYVDSEGRRQYDSLWLFSSDYIMEASQFVTKDSFDMLRITNRVARWEVVKKDYDFKSATDRSRLTLTIQFADRLSGLLKASMYNCDHLKDMLIKYFLPNMAR